MTVIDPGCVDKDDPPLGRKSVHVVLDIGSARVQRVGGEGSHLAEIVVYELTVQI